MIYAVACPSSMTFVFYDTCSLVFCFSSHYVLELLGCSRGIAFVFHDVCSVWCFLGYYVLEPPRSKVVNKNWNVCANKLFSCIAAMTESMSLLTTRGSSKFHCINAGSKGVMRLLHGLTTQGCRHCEKATKVTLHCCFSIVDDPGGTLSLTW